jgi:hypothetical protein
MTRPWTITRQPDRYGFQGPVPTIGCTVGMDLGPKIGPPGKCVCGKELGGNYWVKRGWERLINFCGRSACFRKMNAKRRAK